MMTVYDPDEREWRCQCGSLLGIHRARQLEIRRAGIEVTAFGPVLVTCRKCNERNQLDPAKGPSIAA